MACVLPLIIEHQRDGVRGPVVRFREPRVLADVLGAALAVDSRPETLDEVVAHVKATLHYSVNTGHPRFFDKLFAGSDAVGQVAELVTAVLNTNVNTYAVSPCFTVFEIAVVQLLVQLFGFNAEQSDGIMCPGGSFANFTALVLVCGATGRVLWLVGLFVLLSGQARHRAFPHVRLDGHRAGERPVVFVSAHAHYSLRRATMMAGLGMNACIAVPADIHGRMNVSALSAAVDAAKDHGLLPFMVCATAGTTVTGGYDSLVDIHGVCARHGLWLHVDASWGGSVVVSARHRHLLAGSHLADSLAWCPHKGLGVPVQCSVLLVNCHPKLLWEANNSQAEYLFHSHAAAEFDLADKTLQCGRRADAFKLWLSWKRHGTRGFERRVDAAFANVALFVARVRRRPVHFALLAEPMGQNVCFYFLSRRVRALLLLSQDDAAVPPDTLLAIQRASAPARAALHALTAAVYATLQAAGTLLVNFNPLVAHHPSGEREEWPNFFRIIVNQPCVTEADLDFVLDEIIRLGDDL